MPTLHLQLDASGFEVKEENGEGLFEGFLSVMNTPDQGRDIVLPGAFRQSLEAFARKNQPIPLLWQHNRDEPIGVMYAAKEKQLGDRYGLHGKFRLVLGVQRAREAYALLQAGAVRGMSFGYLPLEVDFDARGHRLLKAVDLREASLVTFPMHPDAQVTQVKAASFRERLRQSQQRREWWELSEVLYNTVQGLLEAEGLNREEKLAALRQSLTEFSKEVESWFAAVLGAADVGEDATEVKHADIWGLNRLTALWTSTMQKAGRVLSAINRRDLEQAIALLQAILARADSAASAVENEESTDGIEDASDLLQAVREEMQAKLLLAEMRAAARR